MRAAFACLGLALWMSQCLAAKTMFPLPPGARNPDHVVLTPKVAEQDHFFIKAVYPETPALKHYSQLFTAWRACNGREKGWWSYGDMSGSEEVFRHNFARYWIAPKNDRAVALFFLYESPGIQTRERPDNDNQAVVVVRYKVPDAAALLGQMDVRCPEAPNNTVERDARKSGARPSP